MSTPSDFLAPDHEPRPEQSPEQQRGTPAPQENHRPPSSPTAADTGPQRRLPQPQHPADERRSATAPPAGPAPQHAGRPPRPHQPYQPSSQPHPNAAAPNAATGWQPSSQEPDDNTAMLSQPDAASGWIRPSVGSSLIRLPHRSTRRNKAGRRPIRRATRNGQCRVLRPCSVARWVMVQRRSVPAAAMVPGQSMSGWCLPAADLPARAGARSSRR